MDTDGDETDTNDSQMQIISWTPQTQPQLAQQQIKYSDNRDNKTFIQQS